MTGPGQADLVVVLTDDEVVALAASLGFATRGLVFTPGQTAEEVAAAARRGDRALVARSATETGLMDDLRELGGVMAAGGAVVCFVEDGGGALADALHAVHYVSGSGAAVREWVMPGGLHRFERLPAPDALQWCTGLVESVCSTGLGGPDGADHRLRVAVVVDGALAHDFTLDRERVTTDGGATETEKAAVLRALSAVLGEPGTRSGGA